MKAVLMPPADKKKINFPEEYYKQAWAVKYQAKWAKHTN
jgi:hypothetical protein